jgi:hypothetical protein
MHLSLEGFISSAASDEALCLEMEKHLRLLRRDEAEVSQRGVCDMVECLPRLSQKTQKLSVSAPTRVLPPVRDGRQGNAVVQRVPRTGGVPIIALGGRDTEQRVLHYSGA